MRGLCEASKLAGYQSKTGLPQVSLGSFSKAQSVFDPELLPAVLRELMKDIAGDLPESLARAMRGRKLEAIDASGSVGDRGNRENPRFGRRPQKRQHLSSAHRAGASQRQEQRLAASHKIGGQYWRQYADWMYGHYFSQQGFCQSVVMESTKRTELAASVSGSAGSTISAADVVSMSVTASETQAGWELMRVERQVPRSTWMRIWVNAFIKRFNHLPITQD